MEIAKERELARLKERVAICDALAQQALCDGREDVARGLLERKHAAFADVQLLESSVSRWNSDDPLARELRHLIAAQAAETELERLKKRAGACC